MVTFDILLSDNEELQATPSGDFVCGDCSNKYIKYIVLAAPGAYKATPNCGVGIYQFVNANSSPAQIERAIRLQLENDVFKRPRINTDNFPIIYIDRVQITLNNGSNNSTA